MQARSSSRFSKACSVFIVGDPLLRQSRCQIHDFPRDLIHAFRTRVAPSGLATKLVRTTKLASRQAAGGQPPLMFSQKAHAHAQDSSAAGADVALLAVCAAWYAQQQCAVPSA